MITAKEHDMIYTDFVQDFRNDKEIPFVYFSEELYISVGYEVVEPKMKSRFLTLNIYTHLGFEEAAEEMR